MDKREALSIFAAALMRELLREDGAEVAASAVAPPPGPPEDQPPQPQFDHDISSEICEHNGIYMLRETCPEHGPDAQEQVTPEELDDLTNDDQPNIIQRAERLRKRREKQEEQARVYAEELENAKGMGPPPEAP
jgi:hypothetical protein